MKKRLRKILLISLFFSAAVPFTMQAMDEEEARRKELGNDDLSSAVEHRDVEAMEQALLFEDDIQPKGLGRRALMQAAGDSCLGIVKLLIGKKVDISKQGRFCSTLLGKAAADGRLETVRLLLESNIDIDEGGTCDYTPLRLAASRGRSGVVKFLLASKADINKKGTSGYTALMVAVMQEGFKTDPKEIQKFTYIIDQLIAEDEVDLWARANDGSNVLEQLEQRSNPRKETINKIRKLFWKRTSETLREEVKSELSVV